MRSPDAAPAATGAALVSPRDIMASGLCIGCGGCVAQARRAEAPCTEARMSMDRYGQLKPSGRKSWLSRRTAAFSRTCPFSPAAADEEVIAGRSFPAAPHGDALIGLYEAAYVGHVAEDSFRASGSSGGMGAVSYTHPEPTRP